MSGFLHNLAVGDNNTDERQQPSNLQDEAHRDHSEHGPAKIQTGEVDLLKRESVSSSRIR